MFEMVQVGDDLLHPECARKAKRKLPPAILSDERVAADRARAKAIRQRLAKT